MTQAALSSVSALDAYLKRTYELQLTDNIESDLQLLLANDKGTLRQILYRLESIRVQKEKEHAIMKRKRWSILGFPLSGSQPSPPAISEDDKSAFLEQIQGAAKKHRDEDMRSDAERSEEMNMAESFDQTNSFDVLLAHLSESPPYSLPNASSSNSSSRMTSVETSPLTSELTSPNLTPTEQAKEPIVLAETNEIHAGTRARLLRSPNWLKHFLTYAVNSRSITWSELTLSHIDAFLSAREEGDIFKAVQQFILRETAAMEVAKALLEMRREEILLKAGQTYLVDAQDKWFGGKVRLSGKLQTSKEGEVCVRLQAPSVGASCQLARRFGSHRVLRLTLFKGGLRSLCKKDNDGYLQNEIRLLDCCFRLFSVKEERSAYTCLYFMIDKDIPDIWSLYNFHSPWQDNADQLLCKYMSRMQLCLSASTPGPLIALGDVREVKDIISPTGEVMTDGAAAISRQVMKSIAKQLDLHALPSAVQGRFNGCKGMWYVSPDADDDDDESMWISIRGSQRKIERSQVGEVCHQTFDLLRVSRGKTPSAIGKQIIPILTCNGVPHAAILELRQLCTVQTILDHLGSEESPKDGLPLAKALEAAGNIVGLRARRLDPQLAAARGVLSRAAQDFAEEAALKAEEEEQESEGEGEQEMAGSTTKRAILSLYEMPYALLLSGFSIMSSQFTCDAVMRAVKASLDQSKDKIVVQRSVERVIIPDPLGVLEEGEIQVRFGRDAPTDPDSSITISAVLGDVLIARLPCLIPTDIRKVKAVIHPQLSLYTNEIVVSTKGDRSLADMLSGGDYDGDTASVYWEPLLVDPFVNADLNKCKPSISLEDAFDQDTRTVGDVIEGRLGEDQDKILESLIQSPLVSPSKKGALGNLHLVAGYQHGFDSQAAIDLAFKFNNNMDGVKTGYKLKGEILKQDKNLFDRELPKWAGQKSEGYNSIPSRRDKRLGSFILDDLEIDTKEALARHKHALDERAANNQFKGDSDLKFLWYEAVELGSLTLLQQSMMTDYCKDVLDMYKEACRVYRSDKETSEARSASSSPQKKYKERPRPRDQQLIHLDEIPAYFERWADDQNLCISFSGQFPLDTGAKDRIRKLLTSCLYVQSRSRWESNEKAAFKIAWSTILQIKSEVKSRQANALFDTVSFPRDTAEALRLGKYIR